MDKNWLVKRVKKILNLPYSVVVKKSGTEGNIVRRYLLNKGMKAIGSKPNLFAKGVRAFGRLGQGAIVGFTAGVGMLILHTQNLTGYAGCVSGCPFSYVCP